MDRELTPKERGYLAILSTGVVIRAEQTRSKDKPSRVWLSSNQPISLKTAGELYEAGLIKHIHEDGEPWWQGKYVISELGKQMLEADKERV